MHWVWFSFVCGHTFVIKQEKPCETIVSGTVP